MINPVLWLDLRIRVRERKLWILLVVFILVLAAVAALSISTAGIGRGVSNPANIGGILTYSAVFLQAGLVLILAPLGAAGRLSQEREQRTIASLINSTLERRSLVLGKLLGCWIFVVWIGILPAPFAILGSLWGGPSVSMIALCMLSNLAAGMTLATIALGLSGFFGRSLTAYLVVGAVIFLWLVVIPLLGMLSISLVSKGVGSTIISYAAFFHHPVFPIFAAMNPGEDFETPSRLFTLIYCFSSWIFLSAGAFWLAVRGVKQEIY